MALFIKIIDWLLRIVPLYRTARDLAKQIVLTIEAVADENKLEGYEKKIQALEMLEGYLKDKGYHLPQWLYDLIGWFIDYTVAQLNKRFGKRWIERLDDVVKFIEKL